MKGFEVYRRRSIRDEWSEYYVEYNVLKEKLKACAKRRKAVRQLMRGNVHLR